MRISTAVEIDRGRALPFRGNYSEWLGDKASRMLLWDVSNGISRRAWARNDNAQFAIARAMEAEPRLRVTQAHAVGDASLLAAATATARGEGGGS